MKEIQGEQRGGYPETHLKIGCGREVCVTASDSYSFLLVHSCSCTFFQVIKQSLDSFTFVNASKFCRHISHTCALCGVYEPAAKRLATADDQHSTLSKSLDEHMTRQQILPETQVVHYN